MFSGGPFFTADSVPGCPGVSGCRMTAANVRSSGKYRGRSPYFFSQHRKAGRGISRSAFFCTCRQRELSRRHILSVFSCTSLLLIPRTHWALRMSAPPCGQHLVPCVKAGVAASFRPVAPVPDSALLSANAFFFDMQNRFLKYFIEWRKTTSEKKYEVTGSGATPPGERYFLRATAIGEVDG